MITRQSPIAVGIRSAAPDRAHARPLGRSAALGLELEAAGSR